MDLAAILAVLIDSAQLRITQLTVRVSILPSFRFGADEDEQPLNH